MPRFISSINGLSMMSDVLRTCILFIRCPLSCCVRRRRRKVVVVFSLASAFSVFSFVCRRAGRRFCVGTSTSMLCTRAGVYIFLLFMRCSQILQRSQSKSFRKRRDFITICNKYLKIAGEKASLQYLKIHNTIVCKPPRSITNLNTNVYYFLYSVVH